MHIYTLINAMDKNISQQYYPQYSINKNTRTAIENEFYTHKGGGKQQYYIYINGVLTHYFLDKYNKSK